MAVTKVPAALQPAFNEIIVEDDAATSLTVLAVDADTGGTISTVLNRAQVNGKARFDLRGFVSRLFRNRRTALASSAGQPWAFEDYRLVAVYNHTSDPAETRFAINAVRQVGESLDLAAEARLPWLTGRAKIGQQRIEIPCYEGFPVGVAVMLRESDYLPGPYIITTENLTPIVLEDGVTQIITESNG